jgi:folate-binding protein YgfZ
MTDRLPIALKSRSLVAVRGPDWRPFLNNLLTNELEDLAVGEARFTALLTPQGRLLYDLFVVARDDEAWLDVEAAWRDALVQRLAMYRLRAKVEIAALEIEVSALPFPLEGGRGRDGGEPTGHEADGAEGIVDAASPVLPQPTVHSPPFPTLPPSRGKGVWVRDPRLPALGWRGYGVEASEPESLYDTHRLALGVPGPADWGTDKSYPIEANFDLLHGIDFHKGCFIGQETTSRMHRRGTVKSRMAPVTFEGPPPAFGADILAGDLRAGEVLSGQDGRAMALVRLDRIEGADLAADGRPVRVELPAWLGA